MKKYRFLHALQLVSGFAVLSACSPIATLPDPFPVTIAKQEMQRAGWKGIVVDRYDFQDGLWEVVLYHKSKIQGGRSYATVKVAPDGTVKKIIQDLE